MCCFRKNWLKRRTQRAKFNNQKWKLLSIEREYLRPSTRKQGRGKSTRAITRLAKRVTNLIDMRIFIGQNEDWLGVMLNVRHDLRAKRRKSCSSYKRKWQLTWFRHGFLNRFILFSLEQFYSLIKKNRKKTSKSKQIGKRTNMSEGGAQKRCTLMIVRKYSVKGEKRQRFPNYVKLWRKTRGA